MKSLDIYNIKEINMIINDYVNDLNSKFVYTSQGNYYTCKLCHDWYWGGVYLSNYKKHNKSKKHLKLLKRYIFI